MFTREHAAALRARIVEGLSEIDPEGNECPVPKKRRKYAADYAAKNPPPSVDALYERFKGATEMHADPAALLDRIRRLTGHALTMPEPIEPVDLAPLAKMAGVSVDAALAAPLDVPPPRVYDPRTGIIAGARIPDRFARLILDGPVRDTAPLRDVRAFLAAGKWGIVLAGALGPGKTAAACIGLVEGVRALPPDKRGGLFVTAEQIAAPDGRELAEIAEEAPLLVLDEMGGEALTDLAIVRIRSLLGARHAQSRRTICTANMSLGDWRGRYGDRLVDRLREGGGFKEYGGASLRGAA